MTFSTPTKTRRINLTPVDYSKAIKTMGMPLSIKEERIKDLLTRVNANSFWGECIRDSFVDYTDTKLRELIAELRSQMADDEDVMFRILGYECFEAIKNYLP